MPFAKPSHNKRHTFRPNDSPLPFRKNERVLVDLREQGRDLGVIKEVLPGSRRAVVDTDHHGRRVVSYDMLSESQEPPPQKEAPLSAAFASERRA